jgi:general nucleoside transport system permease protein
MIMRALRAAVIPVCTVFLAFLIAGLLVLLTGRNPIPVYKAFWVGAGFDWPFHLIPGNPFGVQTVLAANNLQATLVEFTPLVLTGLAVAFAFRCGLFNIGGTGQFWFGAIIGYIVADALQGLPGMVLGTLAGALAGAVIAGVAGALKAYRGAHEVITTIMLNWIVIYGGQYLYGLGGPLVDKSANLPQSRPLHASTLYPGVWGALQPVHIGIFISLGAAVVFWLILNRTTLGYEVRAVGFNPGAARYGGVDVRRSIILAMAIAGSFAGLAGVGQVLGVSGQVNAPDLPVIQLGFTGIAVALLGRNTAVGCVFAALLFAALDSGARNLTGSFSADLAGDFATIVQGVVILLVGGEAIVRWLFLPRRRRVDKDDALAPAPTPEPML